MLLLNFKNVYSGIQNILVNHCQIYLLLITERRAHSQQKVAGGSSVVLRYCLLQAVSPGREGGVTAVWGQVGNVGVRFPPLTAGKYFVMYSSILQYLFCSHCIE